MFFSDKIEIVRNFFNSTNAGLEKILGLSNGYISNIEKSGTDNPGKLLIALSAKGISIDWFLTGNGEIALPKKEIGSVISGNVGNVNVGSIGGDQHFTVSALPVSNENVQSLKVFMIPLLTKEQVLQFNPIKEIPNPKSHSGDYPDYTMVPIPMRFREYSTDLRAIVVFNSLMSPLLNAGDMAIFQAIGWNGDGVYVYRVDNELHISHIQFNGSKYILTKEFKPEEEISYDETAFKVIGRVRAVVREIG